MLKNVTRLSKLDFKEGVFGGILPTQFIPLYQFLNLLFRSDLKTFKKLQSISGRILRICFSLSRLTKQ